MAPTVLNSDILLSILSVSPPKSATSMMETCHFLYHEGAKIVLQQSVCLDGPEEKALALLRFVQAEDLSRCLYVRALHIFIDPMPETVAKLLVNLVPRMTGLRWLRIEAGGEQMLEAYPYLLPVFASLRSVKTLSLFGPGKWGCELVQALQSELISAEIRFDAVKMFPNIESFTSTHPVLLLQQSASMLQEFTCGSWWDISATHHFFTPRVTYPNVRRLVLENNPMPSSSPYIKAFPNLTHLVSQSARTQHAAFLELFQAQRDANLLVQSVNADGERLVWKHLRSYAGSLGGLWTLGLTCLIPELMLIDSPRARSPLALTDVLAHTRPAKLTLRFDEQPLTEVLASDFLTALLTDDTSRVRYLFLQIDLIADDHNLNVGQALTDIETVLSGLQLCHLICMVRDINLSETEAAGGPSNAHTHEPGPARSDAPQPVDTTLSAPSPPSDPSPMDHASLNFAERTLADFDAEAYVRRIFSSLPSLRTGIIQVPWPNPSGGRSRVGCLGFGRKDVIYAEMSASELSSPQNAFKSCSGQHAYMRWAVQ